MTPAAGRSIAITLGGLRDGEAEIEVVAWGIA